jgi:LysM repeat protein
MSFYSLQSNPELGVTDPTLVIAFCHLLTSFGKAADPQSLSEFFADYTDQIRWESITSYDTDVTVASDGPGWPTSKNSIVAFATRNHNGEPTTLYCLIFDPSNRTIIDSTDGTVKNAGVYGEPVQYYSYVFTPKTEPEQEPEPTPTATDKIYTVLKGERLFDIARKLGMTEQDIIDHNDLPDPYNLRVGTQLHLPVAQVVEKKPEITYEYYDTPQEMYVSRPGGAQKWHFGTHDTVKDIVSGSGVYEQGDIIQVYAKATVPVGDETWAYYMDSLAVGDAKLTGRVKYTIGFAHSDLTDGIPVDTPAEVVEEAIEQTIAAVEPAPVVTVPEFDEVLPHPNQWRSTFVRWHEPTTYIVDLPKDEDEIIIRDLEGQRPAKRIKDGGHYVFGGEFWKDGVQYYRPLQAIEADPPIWYGIPAEVLKSEDEVYSTEVELADRLALRSSKLTTIEKYAIPALARTSLSYERLKLYGRKLTNKEKK